MQDPRKDEMETARQARMAGLVMAVAMLGWMGAQVIGGEMGWQPRFALLIDLAALAAFIWALVVTYRIWRKRRA